MEISQNRHYVKIDAENGLLSLNFKQKEPIRRVPFEDLMACLSFSNSVLMIHTNRNLYLSFLETGIFEIHFDYQPTLFHGRESRKLYTTDLSSSANSFCTDGPSVMGSKFNMVNVYIKTCWWLIIEL